MYALAKDCRNTGFPSVTTRDFLSACYYLVQDFPNFMKIIIAMFWRRGIWSQWNFGMRQHRLIWKEHKRKYFNWIWNLIAMSSVGWTPCLLYLSVACGSCIFLGLYLVRLLMIVPHTSMHVACCVMICLQGWFYVFAQPMRDSVNM